MWRVSFIWSLARLISTVTAVTDSEVSLLWYIQVHLNPVQRNYTGFFHIWKLMLKKYVKTKEQKLLWALKVNQILNFFSFFSPSFSDLKVCGSSLTALAALHSPQWQKGTLCGHFRNSTRHNFAKNLHHVLLFFLWVSWPVFFFFCLDPIQLQSQLKIMKIFPFRFAFLTLTAFLKSHPETTLPRASPAACLCFPAVPPWRLTSSNRNGERSVHA